MAKGNEELDERELLAAHVIIRRLGGNGWNIVPRDVKGAGDGTHDFDLTEGDTTIAVEVSTIAVTATVGNYARWDREFPGGAVTVEGLEHGWLLAVASSGNAQKVRKHLVEWLADLENCGELAMDAYSLQKHFTPVREDRPSWFPTVAAMADAGVMNAEVIGELPVGQCHITVFSEGHEYSYADANYVADFVSKQLANAHATDVVKLGRATANRRVLFLWLDAQSHFDVIRRLDHGLLRGSLSGAGLVDEVWLGRQFRDGSVAMYRWTGSDEWDHASFAAEELHADGADHMDS